MINLFVHLYFRHGIKDLYVHVPILYFNLFFSLPFKLSFIPLCRLTALLPLFLRLSVFLLVLLVLLFLLVLLVFVAPFCLSISTSFPTPYAEKIPFKFNIFSCSKKC